ncbi:MAG: hypothetical protein ACI976_001984 [Aureispira sp.]|jgi:hypothetical protein
MKYTLLYLFTLLPILLWGQTLSKTQTAAVPINASTATGILVQEPRACWGFNPKLQTFDFFRKRIGSNFFC